jgi:Fe2+ or Zn2+ uptake regulation protein
LATVYRSLEVLKLEGAVQVRTLANGESLYSSVQRDQHHLTCLNCGASIAINECPVHQLESQLEDSHQFRIYYHTLEFLDYAIAVLRLMIAKKPMQLLILIPKKFWRLPSTHPGD